MSIFLKTVDVKGFRGINQIFLDVNKGGSVLIGENAWGKSSLLSALMFLSPEQMFNQFVSEDFYHNSYKHNTLSITFTFCGEYQNQLSEAAYEALQPVIYLNRSERLQYLIYQIKAEQKEGKIAVEYHFLNEYGDSLFVEVLDFVGLFTLFD